MSDVMTIISPQDMIERVGGPINPLLTVVAVRQPEDAALRYLLCELADGPHYRVLDTVAYLRHLEAVAVANGVAITEDADIVFQAEDIPVDVGSVSWEARSGWRGVRLVPDIYYYNALGYEDFLPDLAAWRDRRPCFVWRGSSTGRFGQLVSDLDDLPRYRLCRQAMELGDAADMALTDVVQTAHPQHEGLIRDRLQQEGLIKPFLPMSEMARCRYIIDIDGNANSWNFMQKLRLGCCTLRVDSEWTQWFSERLIAWRHYVPIAADLSDFVDKARWCLAHPAESEAIAADGATFARDMRFSAEMLLAAKTVFADR